MMRFIAVCETFLYFTFLIILACSVFDGVAKIGRFLSAYLPFGLLVGISFVAGEGVFIMAQMCFTVIQFPLIKWLFSGVKTKQLVFAYLLIYTADIVVLTILNAVIRADKLMLDLVVNTVILGAASMLCLTGAKVNLRTFFEGLPSHVLTVTSLLLFSLSVFSALIYGTMTTKFQAVWYYFLAVSLLLLQLAVCVILPLLVYNAVSNTRLKATMVDYERQIRVQAEHYKALANANYEMRRFRHDFANIRVAVEQLVARGDQEEAICVLRQCSAVMDSHAGRTTFDTGNGIADALLADKQERAAACNARVCFQGALPAQGIDPVDVCVLLGNTLDNAIEACEKMPKDDEKIISVSSDCNSGFLFMTVANPISGKVAVRNGQIATTKDNKTLHGFGLYSLKTVVKKYDGEVKLLSEEDTFTAEISLYLGGSMLYTEKDYE